jgi:hypothetical protein
MERDRSLQIDVMRKGSLSDQNYCITRTTVSITRTDGCSQNYRLHVNYCRRCVMIIESKLAFAVGNRNSIEAFPPGIHGGSPAYLGNVPASLSLSRPLNFWDLTSKFMKGVPNGRSISALLNRDQLPHRERGTSPRMPGNFSTKHLPRPRLRIAISILSCIRPPCVGCIVEERSNSKIHRDPETATTCAVCAAWQNGLQAGESRV